MATTRRASAYSDYTGGEAVKVGIMPADRGGCGLHRMINPGKAVHNMQIPGTEIAFAQTISARYDREGHVTAVPDMDCDVVVMQRVMGRSLMESIPLIQAQGVAVVVEIDDDIERTSPTNAAYQYVHPKTSPMENWSHLREACRMADMVTVSTDALKRYAPHGRVKVIHNRVPRAMLEAGLAHMEGDPIRVGWAGSVGTHPFDLQATGGGVARALSGTESIFCVLGDGIGVRDALRLDEEPEALGWAPIDEYPLRLALAFDIGIVPLEQTAFNQAKSTLKGIEMAAVGIPFVASATDEYVTMFMREGIGVTARRPRDWERIVRRLIEDSSYRNEVRERGLAGIRSAYVLEDHAYEWYDAWREAVKHRRREAVKA
jgi:hypothetical protein